MGSMQILTQRQLERQTNTAIKFQRPDGHYREGGSSCGEKQLKRASGVSKILNPPFQVIPVRMIETTT